jgi:hypothetical protein
MGVWSALFSGKQSNKLEDYEMVFVKWDPDGKEYGPYTLDYLITNSWSGPPVIGRFEGQNRWRNYSYFLEMFDHIAASEEQVKCLDSYGVSVNKSFLLFRDADAMIKIEENKICDARAAARKEKEGHPATKAALKKLDSLGIIYREGVTRAEAKALVDEYETTQELQALVGRLGKYGIRISEGAASISEDRDPENDMARIEQIENFVDLLDQLKELGATCPLPETLDINDLPDLSDRIGTAIFEAEDAESQLQGREFLAGDEWYKLIGRLPQKQLNALKDEIFRTALSESWDFEQNILKCIATHLPDVTLKIIED